MLLEAQSSGRVKFLTLTYGNGPAPTALDYSDVALFLKRWRKNTQHTVRFFCSGELGETFGRPHWHLIVFAPEWSTPDGLLSLKEWPHGNVMVADAGAAAMAYVAGYTLKKSLDDVVLRMSRRPGIGLQRIAELGSELAERVPKIDQFPGVVRVGRQLYPLHRRARDVMLQAYTDGGGRVVLPPAHGDRIDMEAYIVLKSGGWMNQRRLVDDAWEREKRKQLERSYGKAKARFGQVHPG